MKHKTLFSTQFNAVNWLFSEVDEDSLAFFTSVFISTCAYLIDLDVKIGTIKLARFSKQKRKVTRSTCVICCHWELVFKWDSTWRRRKKNYNKSFAIIFIFALNRSKCAENMKFSVNASVVFGCFYFSTDKSLKGKHPSRNYKTGHKSCT